MTVLFSAITGRARLREVPNPALRECDRRDRADAGDSPDGRRHGRRKSLFALVSWTIRLPVKERVTACSIVVLVPAASTEMNATSPSPTVSASAVTSVRPGWRTEFSRARRAVIPRQLTSQPMPPASAGTTR